MAKKLREEPIYVAPKIRGHIDRYGTPYVYDESVSPKRALDPRNIDDKIIIYKRQVEEWFFHPTWSLLNVKKGNNGFVILMVCLSYIEGVEQYRRGQSSRGLSQRFFIEGVQRLYSNQFDQNEAQLEQMYHDARCGLFHNGMVGGRILINRTFPNALQFDVYDIKINYEMLFNDIIADFVQYIEDLSNPANINLRINFNNMFSIL